MHNLISYLPLAVGDLIPSSCEVWDLLLLLFQIVKICSSKICPLDTTYYLYVLVREHNEKFVSIFKLILNPSITSYSTTEEFCGENGPLSHNWSYRFESKHLNFKIYAIINRSRINLTKSLAMRNQLMLCSYLNNFSSELEMKRISTAGNCHECSWVKFEGTKCHVCATVFKRSINDWPQFGKIISISVGKTIKCNTRLYKTVSYINSVDAFVVIITDRFECLEGVSRPLLVKLVDGVNYISLNQFDCR